MAFDPVARGLGARALERTAGRASGALTVAILGNSITSQGAAPRSSDTSTAWDPATAFATDAYTRPQCYDLTSGFAPLVYKATTGGTTGATEPVWPQVSGGTVTDGSVTWTAEYMTGVPSWPTGWWTLAQALSGQRLDEVFVVGRSGDTSDSILSYLDRALAADPDVVFFANMFENDVGRGNAPTLSTITSRFNSFVTAADRVRAAGKRVIVQTVLPDGMIDAASLFTTYSRGNGTKAWVWLNQKIREYARARSDVIFFDAAAYLVDPNPANPVWPENATSYLAASGSGQTLKLTDGIHPYISGHWKLAKPLAALLAEHFPLVDRFGVANEENQRTPNPLMYGTTGTDGANVTGDVATGLRLDAAGLSGTVSGTASIVARTDRMGNWQRTVYDATAGSADGVSLSEAANIALSPFAVGDVVQAFAETRITANPTLLTYVNCWLRFNSGTPQWTYALWYATNEQDIGQFITEDTTFVLKTLPFPISPSTATIQVYNRAFGRGAASYTVDMGRMALGRTSVPALA